MILWLKKLEIRINIKTVRAEKKTHPKTDCHEIEPYPSKKRAMHDGRGGGSFILN
jgi:hypothetical protein